MVSARSALFPAVSLNGNYYTQREGFQNGNDWDVTLKFDVPVFELDDVLGGLTDAGATAAAAHYDEQETRRMAVLDIQDAYDRFSSSEREVSALSGASAAAKENYEILTKEYGQNLVSNLEVLDALRRTQEVERRYTSAIYQNKKNFWKLKVAAGMVSERSESKQ